MFAVRRTRHVGRVRQITAHGEFTPHNPMSFSIAAAFVAAGLVKLPHVGGHFADNRIQVRLFIRQFALLRQSQNFPVAQQVGEKLQPARQRLLKNRISAGRKNGSKRRSILSSAKRVSCNNLSTGCAAGRRCCCSCPCLPVSRGNRLFWMTSSKAPLSFEYTPLMNFEATVACGVAIQVFLPRKFAGNSVGRAAIL